MRVPVDFEALDIVTIAAIELQYPCRGRLVINGHGHDVNRPLFVTCFFDQEPDIFMDGCARIHVWVCQSQLSASIREGV